MHTLIVVAIGLLVLTLSAAVGHAAGGRGGMLRGLLAFVPLWFMGAAINMYIGVTRAGYSLADEAPILAVVFGVPAAVALGLWWKLR